MPRSRRIKNQVTTNTGMEVTESFCRVCMKMLPARMFYPTFDPDIDRNGLMSICRESINEMFEKFLQSANGSFQKATLRMCQILNIKYDESAIDAAMRQIESKGYDNSKFFGLYKAKLVVTNRSSVTESASDLDLTYQNPVSIVVHQEKLKDGEFEGSDELKKFWGVDDKSDIEFLENEFANFKRSHKADTYSEIVLLKEVCFKLLEIHQDRKMGSLKDSSLKSLQEIMKSLAISPNMANAASGGKSQDSFGMWIKDIENLTPAEWIKDKSISRDVDDIEAYGEKFITSPLRALVTGSREFTLDGSEESDDSEGE
jgi:hypothetical protein